MAPNSHSANSQPDIEGFSRGLEDAIGRVGSITVRDVLGISLFERVTQKNVNETVILKDMISKIDQPILKGLAMDTITVLSNWFNDPETVCCLIQGIWSMYAASNETPPTDFRLADTDFVKWLDVLISFIDLIIVLLTSDLKKLELFIPDFIKEITNAIIGAILLVLQETLFALRDSIINRILAEIDDAADQNSIWAKCLPLQQLLDVIKRYVSDYGLFAELFEKIKGFISGKVGDFGRLKDLGLPKNVRDLEFLYWFRDLLLKLKQATLNFDLCVFYGNAATGGNTNPEDDPDNSVGNGGILASDSQIRRPNPSEVQGLKLAADGTILEDRAQARENTIPILTNSSVRTFLNKYYGFPLDVVDNVLTGTTSDDNVQGTNINSNRISDINADCPNSPSPEEIVKWALRVRNRNLG